MRTLSSLFAAGLLVCSMSAIAADDPIGTEGRGSDSATGQSAGNTGSVIRDGTAKSEYNNECAWGLANGQHVQTNCAVNMTGENGKTYCFSNDKAMAAFMKDPTKNMSKANETFGRS